MTPGILILVFVCLLGLGAGLCKSVLCCHISLPKWQWLTEDRFFVSCICAMLVGFIGLATIGLYTEKSSWSSTYTPKHVSMVKYDSAQYDELGMFMEAGSWIWCSKNCLDDLPVSIDVESRVAPITENPKVRNLAYVVRTRLTDPRAYAVALSLSDDNHNLQRASDVVLSELYEFNNAQSKALASFYNPKDVRQTNGLAELLKREINPRLKSKGMEITELVSWDVE